VPDIYRVQISPADVGRRIMVRRRLTDGREGLGDVVGDLLSWADAALTIRTRAGDVVVDEASVVAGKTVPAPVARRGTRTVRRDPDPDAGASR
jgi:hypothetical protein